jgi:hypothetical protein
MMFATSMDAKLEAYQKYDRKPKASSSDKAV